MFSRTLSISLKPNTLNDFTQTLDKEIIPMLRKQAGFRDEICLASDDNTHVTAVTCVLSSLARQISSRNPACLRSMGMISLSNVWVKSFRVLGFKEIESVRENMGNLLKGWGC